MALIKGGKGSRATRAKTFELHKVPFRAAEELGAASSSRKDPATITSIGLALSLLTSETGQSASHWGHAARAYSLRGGKNE